MAWAQLQVGLSCLHFSNSPLLVSCPLPCPPQGLQSEQTKTLIPPRPSSACGLQWLSISFRMESGLLSLDPVASHDMACFSGLFTCLPIKVSALYPRQAVCSS